MDVGRRLQLEAVRALHESKRARLGSRRMSRELRRQGHDVGRYRARSLMREAGAVCQQRRRFKATTDSRHGHAIAPNLLQRAFEVDAPNRVWVADITAVWTFSGWVYLAAPPDYRLVGRQTHAGGIGHGCSADGDRAATPRTGTAASFGQGLAVRIRRLPHGSRSRRHGAVDEPQRRLLG